MKYEQPNMEIMQFLQECICNVSVTDPSGGGGGGNASGDTSVPDDMFG